LELNLEIIQKIPSCVWIQDNPYVVLIFWVIFALALLVSYMQLLRFSDFLSNSTDR